VRQHDDSDQRNNGGETSKGANKGPNDLRDQLRKTSNVPTFKS